jgi:hypothetical protein
VPTALTHLVGTAGKQQHRKNRCNPWQRRQHANFQVIGDTHAFDDGGQPKTHSIQTHSHGEVNGGSVIGFISKIEALEAENQSIQGQLLQQKIEIQLKSISGDKVSGDISKLQEENNKLKEDILFYEKIVGKKR